MASGPGLAVTPSVHLDDWIAEAVARHEGELASSPAARKRRAKRIAWVGGEAEIVLTFGRDLARLGWIEGRNVHSDYRAER
jgi:hypothetical protein